MKKTILTCMILSVLLVLCACHSSKTNGGSGSESPSNLPLDVKCTIGEMNFKLAAFSMEEDQDKTNKAYDKANTVSAKSDDDEDSETKSAKDFKFLQWYTTEDHQLSVGAYPASYKNDELEDYMEELHPGEDASKYTYFDLDGGRGRYGVATIKQEGETYNNYAVEILSNGMFYAFTFYNVKEMPNMDVKEFIQEISFDRTLTKNQTVKCGDLTVEISGDYQANEVEDDEEYKDYTSWVQTGDATKWLEICYLKGKEYKDAKELADYVASELEVKPTSENASFGTVYYAISQEDEGDCAGYIFFKYNKKLYYFVLQNEDGAVTLDELKAITKTIKTK